MLQPVLKGLEGLGGILGKFGINPAEILKGFEGDAAEGYLKQTKAQAIARLEKDGTTPAVLCDDDTEKRHLIHQALFAVLKPPVRYGHLADLLRDRFEPKIAPILLPQLRKTWTTEQLVDATAHEIRRLLF
jgi:hypothetical protein